MAGGINKKTYRILFLADHRPNRSPGQRFRFEQYLSALEAAGFECEISFLLDEKQDRVFYQPGHYFQKAMILASHYRKRLRDLRRREAVDLVFVFREALLTRSTLFERLWKKRGVKLIFDFDDSIWLPNISAHNKAFRRLKNPGKTAHLVAFADMVFAGNEYLKQFALQYNSQVCIVPTTIDLDQYDRIKEQPETVPICIGWSGSLTTIAHFKVIEPFLEELKAEFGAAITFKVIGDAHFHNKKLGIRGQAWRADTEVDDLMEIDIGIMPLPDDPWSAGKCGLKGLQYMALGIPTVMSAVGVNTQIIRHGKNGMLAKTPEEMICHLRVLIADRNLRKNLGMAGRATVENEYSKQAWVVTYVKLIQGVLTGVKD